MSVRDSGVTFKPGVSGHGKGCWYFEYVTSCVLCGRTSTVRERRWDRKPVDRRQRFEYVETACFDHFL